MDSQHNTSYSTLIQYYGPSSHRSATRNYFRSEDYRFRFDIWSSSDVRSTLYRSAATTRRIRTLRAADGRFHPNRKWKYGGSRLNVLAIHDFLFDFNTIYGPNCHRLAAINYFWSRRHRKWRHQTSFNVQEHRNICLLYTSDAADE